METTITLQILLSVIFTIFILVNFLSYWIICNRPLLISNAFEELIQERLLGIHQIIRRIYNKVGDLVHRYYGIFNNKYVSDLVYIAMKPFEWMFLLTLYLFDQKPENRIAKQYLHFNDRQKSNQSDSQ